MNSGIGRAGKVLRRVLGLADKSSAVTNGVVAAARGSDPQKLIAAICGERLAFLMRLSTWPVFGRGWGRRVAGVRAAAFALAAGAKPEAQSHTSTPGKGEVRVNKAAPKIATGGAIAAGSATAHVSGWEPMTVVVIVVVTVAVAAGAWALWHWHRKHQQEAPVARPVSV